MDKKTPWWAWLIIIPGALAIMLVFCLVVITIILALGEHAG